jgi:hypothetical protein
MYQSDTPCSGRHPEYATWTYRHPIRDMPYSDGALDVAKRRAYKAMSAERERLGITVARNGKYHPSQPTPSESAKGAIWTIVYEVAIKEEEK